jgi:DeoR/GlpR family transcriptional regulator of sugar metabolism
VCHGDEVRYARHRAIADEVRDGAVSVQDLVARLGVSPATIRRDLAELSHAGLVRRVHGGAAPLAVVEVDRPYEEAADDAAAEKRAIARHAAGLVEDGDTLLLDIGTTTGALARELRGRRVTVITPSLAVLDELRGDPVVDVVVLGGFLRRAYLSLVGPLTEEALRRVRASIVFLGTSGVGADGSVLDTTSVEVPTKRRLLEAGGRVVLLADHTKFPGQGSIRVCDFASVSVLITTARADPATLDIARAHGTQVVLVPDAAVDPADGPADGQTDDPTTSPADGTADGPNDDPGDAPDDPSSPDHPPSTRPEKEP